MQPPHATIGKLEAELGNATFTLGRSAYLGNALSLCTRADAVEWLGPRSDEFSFTANGRVIGLLEVGYVEWIDDTNALGAVLTQRRMGAGFALTIQELALRAPGALLRRVSLLNTSGETQVITRATALAWTLRGRTECLPEAPGALCSRCAADRGLFIAGEGYVPEAISGELDQGRLVLAEERVLAPGATWTWPTHWIAPFQGDIAEAWLRTRGHLREAVDRWDQYGSVTSLQEDEE